MAKNGNGEASAPDKINTNWVRRNNDMNQAWNQYLVFLPDGVWINELREDPKLWAAVQHQRFGHLRQFDEVCLVSFDRTMFTTCRVVYADQFGAEIDAEAAQRNVVEMKPPVLRENAVARVIVSGPSYAVQRKADGVLLARNLANLEAAGKELDALVVEPVGR